MEALSLLLPHIHPLRLFHIHHNVEEAICFASISNLFDNKGDKLFCGGDGRKNKYRKGEDARAREAETFVWGHLL